MLSIGEFAQATALSVSAVRFYGDRGLLLPAHVDPTTGYRSYRHDQVATASLIRDLRLIGMPLAAIDEAIGLPAADLADAVATHLATLDEDLEHARLIASRLNAVRSSEPATGAPPTAGTEGTAENKEAAKPTVSAPTVIRANDLLAALRQVIPSASTDDTHPHLMTIVIDAEDGSIRIAATDTYRLTVRDLIPSTSGADFTVVIAASAACQLLAAFDDRDDITITVTTDQVTFSAPGHDVQTRALPIEFPDYERFLERPEVATTVVADRASLRDALESFDESGAVLVSVAQNQLTLERRGQRSIVPVEATGPPLHVAVNPQFMMDGVAGAIANEVAIEIEPDALRPVVFRSATDGTYVSVLMPFKLD